MIQMQLGLQTLPFSSAQFAGKLKLFILELVVFCLSTMALSLGLGFFVNFTTFSSIFVCFFYFSTLYQRNSIYKRSQHYAVLRSVSQKRKLVSLAFVVLLLLNLPLILATVIYKPEKFHQTLVCFFVAYLLATTFVIIFQLIINYQSNKTEVSQLEVEESSAPLIVWLKHVAIKCILNSQIMCLSCLLFAIFSISSFSILNTLLEKSSCEWDLEKSQRGTFHFYETKVWNSSELIKRYYKKIKRNGLPDDDQEFPTYMTKTSISSSLIWLTQAENGTKYVETFSNNKSIIYSIKKLSETLYGNGIFYINPANGTLIARKMDIIVNIQHGVQFYFFEAQLLLYFWHPGIRQWRKSPEYRIAQQVIDIPSQKAIQYNSLFGVQKNTIEKLNYSNNTKTFLNFGPGVLVMVSDVAPFRQYPYQFMWDKKQQDIPKLNFSTTHPFLPLSYDWKLNKFINTTSGLVIVSLLFDIQNSQFYQSFFCFLLSLERQNIPFRSVFIDPHYRSTAILRTDQNYSQLLGVITHNFDWNPEHCRHYFQWALIQQNYTSSSTQTIMAYQTTTQTNQFYCDFRLYEMKTFWIIAFIIFFTISSIAITLGKSIFEWCHKQPWNFRTKILVFFYFLLTSIVYGIPVFFIGQQRRQTPYDQIKLSVAGSVLIFIYVHCLSLDHSHHCYREQWKAKAELTVFPTRLYLSFVRNMTGQNTDLRNFLETQKSSLEFIYCLQMKKSQKQIEYIKVQRFKQQTKKIEIIQAMSIISVTVHYTPILMIPIFFLLWFGFSKILNQNITNVQIKFRTFLITNIVVAVVEWIKFVIHKFKLINNQQKKKIIGLGSFYLFILFGLVNVALVSGAQVGSFFITNQNPITMLICGSAGTASALFGKLISWVLSKMIKFQNQYSPQENQSISSFQIDEQENKDQLIFPGKPPNYNYLNHQSSVQLSAVYTQSNHVKEAIIGKDRRQKVTNSGKQYPYTAVGLLYSRFGQKRIQGTGFLIKPNLILTCSHNVYDHASKTEASEIYFYPGLKGNEGDEYKIKKYYFCQDFIESDKPENEYAVLELFSDIGDIYGYFGLDFTKNKKRQKTVKISGYPEKVMVKKVQQSGNGFQYCMSGNWSFDTKNSCVIKYRICTSAGQSGSPVFYIKKNMPYAIGIHTTGSKQFNLGRRVKADIENNFGSLKENLQQQ